MLEDSQDFFAFRSEPAALGFASGGTGTRGAAEWLGFTHVTATLC